MVGKSCCWNVCANTAAGPPMGTTRSSLRRGSVDRTSLTIDSSDALGFRRAACSDTSMKSIGSPNDRLSSGRNIVANALWEAKSRSYEYSNNT